MYQDQDKAFDFAKSTRVTSTVRHNTLPATFRLVIFCATIKKINKEKNIISVSYHRYVRDVIKSNMLYSIGMMFLPLSGGDFLLRP